MNFKDVIEWIIPEGPVVEVRETNTGRIIWRKNLDYNIYFFNINPKLLRTNYLPTDTSNDFFVIGTSDKDFLCYESQPTIKYVEYKQYKLYTRLPSPEEIGLEIPEGYYLDKWVDTKGNEYDIGYPLLNTEYDKILYAKWAEYDNLIDNYRNDVITLDNFEIEISKT